MDSPLLALTRPGASGSGGRSRFDLVAENMRQLVQLRWIAAAGQLIAILVAHFGLGVPLPLVSMIGVVGLLAMANLLFVQTLRRRRVFRGELTFALLLDMAALTALLYLSGGADNPFMSLYLVQVVLGAILLRPRAVWLLAIVSASCAAFLSARHLPLNLPTAIGGRTPNLELFGEWVSFAMVTLLLVMFIGRISRNLRARDTYLTQLNQRAAEEDGIVRMGLFASGAAHELGTPLSSLAVLLSDWQRNPVLADDAELRQELAEAQSEVRRCKEIVSNILQSAGSARGEAMEAILIAQFVEQIAAEWRGNNSTAQLQVEPIGAGGARVASEPALRQALWSLLDNAAHVSPQDIVLRSEVQGSRLILSVLDRGPGFADEQLTVIGTLGQSSKGSGRGVGLFLASNVVRRLGGALEASNRPEGGASVRLVLPLASRAEEDERG